MKSTPFVSRPDKRRFATRIADPARRAMPLR